MLLDFVGVLALGVGDLVGVVGDLRVEEGDFVLVGDLDTSRSDEGLALIWILRLGAGE